MTSYQIMEMYKSKFATKMTVEVCDYMFTNDKRRATFKNPDEMEKICRLRASGETYANISRIIGKAIGTVRDSCERVRRKYNWYIVDERHQQLELAKPANYDVFRLQTGIHDVNSDDVIDAIANLPMWDWKFENSEERKQVIKEWFYHEVNIKKGGKNMDGLKETDFDYSCTNDEPYCKCRICQDNKAYGGTCTHCVTCIDGERAMDVCSECK